MYGADPRFVAYGSKSGGRKVFAEEGVPHPVGADELHSEDEIIEAIRTMRSSRPQIELAMVKHNDGVSGEGNAQVNLAGLPAAGSSEEIQAIRERLHSMRLELEHGTVIPYLAELAEQGGIIEERVVGDQVRSPSVQLRVTPLGRVEVLSTHDQVLGGASGQSYLGCRFPADPDYSVMITREAVKVGERLRREGILGRFAVDFVVVRENGGEWRPYAIEINLRKGGTTGPYLTLEFLTNGRYFVFEHAEAAGRYAIELSDLVRSSDWERFGLPGTLDMRVGLHSGPVYSCTDPITKGAMFTGPHTSRTARIEPITPPGQVYASSAFAAVAAASGVAGLNFDYIGRTNLAKKYGSLALYHVQRPSI